MNEANIVLDKRGTISVVTEPICTRAASDTQPTRNLFLKVSSGSDYKNGYRRMSPGGTAPAAESVAYFLEQRRGGAQNSQLVRTLGADDWYLLSTESISSTEAPTFLSVAGLGVIAIRAQLVNMSSVGTASDSPQMMIGTGPVGSNAPDSFETIPLKISLSRGGVYLAARCTLDPISALLTTYVSSSVTDSTTQSAIVAPSCAADDSALDAAYRLAFSPTAIAQDVHTLTGRATTLGLNYSLSVPGQSMISWANGARNNNSRITLTVPAGQVGVCATGRCSETMRHTLYVIY